MDALTTVPLHIRKGTNTPGCRHYHCLRFRSEELWWHHESLSEALHPLVIDAPAFAAQERRDRSRSAIGFGGPAQRTLGNVTSSGGGCPRAMSQVTVAR